uniref:TELO2 interacting protein 1 n=1 Tax=Cyprinus carpio TaxID=7962 RepID=A0A8C2L201_CYPCA
MCIFFFFCLRNPAFIAFAYLRPSCVLLTKEPTAANAEALSGHLRSVSDGALQQLQDYVLFPLRFVLKTPGSKWEGLVQAVLEVMTYVLENTCVQSWDSLQDLFSELCLCLCSPKDPGKPATTSEELKLAVLRCLDALLHSPSMLPGLGAAVSLLLALEHVEPRQDERYLLGRTLATFLPGISRAQSLVISGDVRQGHAVTVKAMRVWYKVVGLVMADEQLQKTDNDVAAGDLGRVEELVVKSTPSWCKATSQWLALVLPKIISCTSSHLHWRVRLELVNLSHFLLSQCSQFVGECVGPLLEALVGAIKDEEPEVKRRCNAALDEVAQKGQTNGGQDFTDVLSENLHSLVSSLPRLMRMSDDQHKLFVLNVFLGYLKILGPKVNAVLTSAVHLERISKALMQVMELDVTDVKIIEEKTLTSSTNLGPDMHQIPSQRKYFLYFTEDKIFSALRKICRMLGCYGNLYLLVDRFMELYKESSVYRKQAALVLNEVIVGAAGIGVETNTSRIDCSRANHSRTSQEDLKSSIMSIIEEYISLSNWHLPTVSEALEGKLESTTSLVSNNPERNCLQLLPASKSPMLHQLNSNIWQICTDFHVLLMTTLYPMLEKAGDKSLLVSQAAFSATCDLCKACDYNSPKELVIKNSDYLLNDVSLNLARPSIHPHAPRVLAVMFAHSDASLLPLVADVVQDVLTALDLSYDQRAPQFCSVLHSLMKALGMSYFSFVSLTIISNNFYCMFGQINADLVSKRCIVYISILDLVDRQVALYLLMDLTVQVLCVLGESCGDFLRTRVSKEVLPRLTSSLMKQVEVSARSEPVYMHTLAYKLQLAVLQGLGPLCVKLHLSKSPQVQMHSYLGERQIQILCCEHNHH